MTRLIAVITMIMMLIATTADAQIFIDPNPKSTFICIEKSDAYRLALADIQGTLDAILVRKFREEGKCEFLPATYLFTIDQYLDSAGKPSRVIEMTAHGERVWGITGSLPNSVWLI